MQHKYGPGQIAYYKPGDFAPLQAIAGGCCTIVRQLDGEEGANFYHVRLADNEERVVRENELTLLSSPGS